MKCRPSMSRLQNAASRLRLQLATAGERSAFRQAQLHDVGPLGAEASLAIAEIEAPQAPEALVEAEAADVVPGALEPPRPFRERVGIVLAEADDAPPFEASPRRFLLEAHLRGQHAAGKHIL